MTRRSPVFKSLWSTLNIGTERYRSAQNGTTQRSSEIELYLSVPLSDTRSGTIVAQSRPNVSGAQLPPPIRSFSSSNQFSININALASSAPTVRIMRKR